MNILVLGRTILAVDPVDAVDCWQTADQIIPKHVAIDAELFEAGDLPADYAPGRYAYDGGFVLIAPPPAMPALVDYDQALVVHLDAVARSRNWADRISLMARAGFAGPWQAEAIAFGQWADGCNVIALRMLDEYQAGTIEQPTVDEVIAALPEMVWPAPAEL